MPRHYAIVPAAGSGARFGAEKPKQYLDLLGRPLIFHTLAALTAHPAIERVWVVLSPDDAEWSRHDWLALGPKLETVRCGGATRAASVTNGLRAAAMAAADDDWILVHDAARPCLSAAMLDALENCPGVTDEAGAIEALGLAPKLVRGDSTNLKVTYPADLALAAMILRARQ